MTKEMAAYKRRIGRPVCAELQTNASPDGGFIVIIIINIFIGIVGNHNNLYATLHANEPCQDHALRVTSDQHAHKYEENQRLRLL